MANNLYQDDARVIAQVAATAPASPTTGTPVVLGQIPGVALTDEAEGGNDSGNITLDRGGIYNVSVVAAGAAVAIGDIVYYDGGVLNDDSSNGTRWGYALGTVANGGTGTIPCILGY